MGIKSINKDKINFNLIDDIKNIDNILNSFKDRKWDIRETLYKKAIGLLSYNDINYIKHIEDIEIQRLICQYGEDHKRDLFVNTNNYIIKQDLIDYDFNNRYKDMFINDGDWRVRARIAIDGNERQKNILMYDSNANVRESVCVFANERQCKILLNDINDNVKNRANARLQELKRKKDNKNTIRL